MGIFDGGGVATVSVDVEGDLSKFKQDLRGASAEVDKEFGGKNGPFGKNGARIGTAMAAGAAAGFAKSITEFGSFEKGLNEVFTLIPDAGDEAFGDLTEQTKDFSKEFGVLPNEVIPALYDSISAGVSQDNVFDFLEESNKLAKAGATDLTTAVDGLTTGLNAYGLEATESSRVSDALFAGVKAGKTTVSELSDSLFQIAPVANLFGVEIEQVTASVATLTGQGVPTRIAATQMRAAIAELGRDGTKASKAFQEITGQTFPDFIASGGTVADAAFLMQDSADELGLSLIDLFGSVEGGQAFAGLTADADKTRETFAAVADATGSTQEAFERMDTGLAPILDKIKARLSVAFIELGTTIAPAVEKFGLAIAGLVELLADLPGPVSAGILGFVGLAGATLALAGPMLRAAQVLKGVGVAFKALTAILAANPYILLIAATIALVIFIVKNWEDVKRITLAAWQGIRDGFTPILNSLRNFFGEVFGAIGGFIQRFGIDPVKGLLALFRSIPETASAAWTGLVDIISTAVETLKLKLGELASFVDSALGPVDEIIGTVARATGGGLGIFGFDQGGVVPGPKGDARLVLAHGGETFLPTHKQPLSDFTDGGGEGGGVNVTMQVSSEVRDPGFFERQAVEIARVVEREVNRQRKAGGR